MIAKTHNKDEGSKLNKIESYLKPKLIYIPLEDENNNTYRHIVKQGDYIYKGDVVAVNNKLNLKMYSSVSGYALYGSNKLIKTGKKVRCIVIENDFKEKVRKNKKTITYTKEELIKLLSKNKIELINNYLINDTKLLIINISNNNSNNNIIIDNYTEEMLETIDNIIEILEISKTILLVNNKYKNIFKKLSSYSKTYSKIEIKLTNNIYLPGCEEKLLNKELNMKSNNKVAISNIYEIHEIAELLKTNIPISEKIINISGDGINNNTNIKVKVGTLVSEVIYYIGGYKNIKDPLLVIGNLINGTSVCSDDLIITKDIDSIYIVNNKYEKNSSCINCGKCIEVCPSKISPLSILEGNSKKIEKCTECGLCSFICPSKIEVLEVIKQIKKKANI